MAKKRSFLIPFFATVLLLPFVVKAQSFEASLSLYKQHNYKQAASAFTKLNTPEAQLFAAKSYYALGRFRKAENVLNELLQNVTAPGIYYEAAYTSALVDFQQKQFPDGLVKLYTVYTNSQLRSLAAEAEDFYKQIINYLTGEQRLEAIKNIKPAQIKYDLVNTALGKVSFESLKEIINQFYESVDKRKWRKKVKEIESSLSNEPAYKIEYGDQYNSLTPPDGTVYNIGILLPKFKSKKPTYSVIQGLYLGARLAANQFNKSHSDVKAYLTFLPTGMGDLEEIVASFAQTQGGDFIIGPLFSKQAGQLVSKSTEYKIPIIAPLATSDLKSKGTFFFQANSNFSIHGETMAKFAVNELGYDNFAVIAGKNTSGEKSAAAFKKTVEALGGHIVSFQIEDFEKSKYDISTYVKKIGAGLPKVDAVYAPFTSEYTAHLAEQLIYAVNTFEDPVTLLGSPKWESIDFSTDIYSRSELFYSVNSFRNERLNSFQRQYRQYFGIAPNKYAVIGYDVSRYLLQLLDQIGNPGLLKEAMLQSSYYRGLVKNVYYNGGNVNKAVQILKVGPGGRSVLQDWHLE